MLVKYSSIVKKAFFVLLSFLGIVLLAMLITPYFFKVQIQEALKKYANEHIQGELHFTSFDISFFTHFPTLSASIAHVQLKGAAPFEDRTLLEVEEISFGIDLLSLLKDKIVLDKFIISEGKINVLVDSTGKANYAIFSTSPQDTVKTQEASESSEVAFQLLKLKNIHLTYSDASIPLQIEAHDLNYEGRGDLTSTLFDLQTHADMEALTVIFNNEKYVDRKRIHAQLVTQINTSNLSFIFEKNDITINKLPVRFKGVFAFLANGYHVDFKLNSQESTLPELLSLIPPSYAPWLNEMKVEGNAAVFLNVKGDYIVEENKMPSLSCGLVINNGFLAHKQAKVPISELNTSLNINLPHLNPDSIRVELEKFQFKVADGYFQSQGSLQGINPLAINATVNSALDLSRLNQALQWPDFSFGGQFNLEGQINGTYATDTLTYGLRNKKKAYIASIPTFEVKQSLENGYFKLSSMPAAIDKIAYRLLAIAKDNQIKNTKLTVDNIDIKALNNYIKGYAIVKDLQKLQLDANIQADINLADIKQVYPLDSVDIAGNVFVNVVSKGFMDLSKNKIPATEATISLKNGYLKAWTSPIPLEDIAIETHITSTKGTLGDLNIKVLPISFRIAGEPFFVHADLKNFTNLNYRIQSKGKLNLEPLYRLFAIEGTNIQGSIRTNFNLAGLQSDAVKGYYNRLKNEGFIDIDQITVNTDLLPLPVLLKSGKFSFRKEKLNVNKFLIHYANNQIQAKGYIDNIINYLTTPSSALQGKLELQSEQLIVDDFMAFQTSSGPSTTETNHQGIVLLPEDLNFEIKGSVNKVIYHKTPIHKVSSTLVLTPGNLALKNTQFEIAGLQSVMDINYRPLSPYKAKFDFVVKAHDFDIQRAYKEIPLFSELMSTAQYIHGKVSLDYQLGGLLNAQMSPIMPSLYGKGSLTLDEIKLYNFKLLNAISQSTGKESLTKGETKKVKINTRIQNNVMTIERTKMKMAGFRPRFEGQVTLDGQMNIGFRLGLPPLGILGIPLRITGTTDNYKIKLGKYNEQDLDTALDEEDKALYEASVKQDSI